MANGASPPPPPRDIRWWGIVMSKPNWTRGSPRLESYMAKSGGCVQSNWGAIWRLGMKIWKKNHYLHPNNYVAEITVLHSRNSSRSRDCNKADGGSASWLVSTKYNSTYQVKQKHQSRVMQVSQPNSVLKTPLSSTADVADLEQQRRW